MGRGAQAGSAPFVGFYGGTWKGGTTVNDGVGSGGLLARWIGGRHWMLELGWVEQFSVADNRGFWNNWLLDNGLYSKIQYRF